MIQRSFRGITLVMVLGVFLMFLAVFTITSTFAFPDRIISKEFKIGISDVALKNIKNTDIQINENRILFNIHLTEEENLNSFTATIKNFGNVDAILSASEPENINDIYLFSKNEKDYFLSDFILYNIVYAEDNVKNKIILNKRMEYGDNYLAGTFNKIEVIVRLKNNQELSDEEKEALKEYLQTKHSIDKTLYLNLSFTSK